MPLIIGTGIYILFGNPEIRLLKYFRFGGTYNSWINEQPHFYWFVYNLPDGLWAYSLASFITILHHKSSKNTLKSWLISCFLISAGYELLQKIDLISGTGDALDVVFYLFFGIIAYLKLRH